MVGVGGKGKKAIRISDYEMTCKMSKDQSGNTVKMKEGDEAGEEWKLQAQDHSVTESEFRSAAHTEHFLDGPTFGKPRITASKLKYASTDSGQIAPRVLQIQVCKCASPGPSICDLQSR